MLPPFFPWLPCRWKPRPRPLMSNWQNSTVQKNFDQTQKTRWSEMPPASVWLVSWITKTHTWVWTDSLSEQIYCNTDNKKDEKNLIIIDKFQITGNSACMNLRIFSSNSLVESCPERCCLGSRASNDELWNGKIEKQIKKNGMTFGRQKSRMRPELHLALCSANASQTRRVRFSL